MLCVCFKLCVCGRVFMFVSACTQIYECVQYTPLKRKEVRKKMFSCSYSPELN